MLKNKGFTLIELLVVISIIGILVGVISVSFSSSQKQARDTERKSDLVQYRNALESYANAHGGLYPAANGTMQSVCGASLSDYAAFCPADPKSPAYEYIYNSDGTSYRIYTASGMEAVTGIWVVCYNGKSGLVTWSSGQDPYQTAVLPFCPF